MKPLLFSLLARPTHPTRDGASIRNFHLVAALARECRVRAFALRAPHLGEGAGEYPEGIEVFEVPQADRRFRRAGAAALALAGGDSYPERLYRSAPLERAIARALEKETPAWIVAHTYHVAPLALRLGRPVWIDFHNLDSEIWERTAHASSSALVRWFAASQAPRVRSLEERLVRAGAGLSCVSERDASRIRSLEPRSAPVVVPNGVDLARYRFRAEPAPEKVLFFVGDLSWPPNADAIRWFHSRVWPQVRREHPDALVEILGREPPADLLRAGRDDFRVVGEGDDTRPFWRRAALAVVPLLAGGGTRLKILEAAACGVPVVSTSIGAEGLDFEPARDIALADEPASFARAICALLADPEARRRQAAAARCRVERSYGWEEIGRRFAREVAGAGRSS